MQKRSRNILLISIVFTITLASLFTYNWIEYQRVMQKYQQCDDTWCIRIYGNVQEESFFGISNVLNGDFERLENRSFYYLNMYNTSRTFNVSGIRVWDVLQSVKILLGDYEYIRFEATDGYKTYLIPISLVIENPDSFLIISHINGEPIPSKEDGGDGPLMSAVFLDALAQSPEMIQIFQDNLPPGFNHVHNSKFTVKYLNAIYLE